MRVNEWGIPMFHWISKRRLLEDILEGQRVMSRAIKDLRDDVEELAEKFENKDEENTSLIDDLRKSLQGKTSFIEGLFSTVLDKSLGNGHTNGHTKENATLVDVSKLSSSMRTMIEKQLKEGISTTAKKLP